MTGELLRAGVFHTPRNPFREERALESFADGGLLIRGGRIAACGDYSELHASHPEVPVRDLRGGYLIPGLIDTHIHFPQLRVLGGLGYDLLDWLECIALPEEARMSDVAYACDVARRFVRALGAHGTTTALVFGAHFKAATAALFRAAERSGIRVVSGMVISDRGLRPELRQAPPPRRHRPLAAGPAHDRGKLKTFPTRPWSRPARLQRFLSPAPTTILEEAGCADDPTIV